MPPKDQSRAQRAYRIRKALVDGKKVTPTERLWLAEYEHDHPGSTGRSEPIDVDPLPAPAAKPAENYGRSRSGRKVNLQIEEAAESEGRGENPATAAAVAALTAREEGRRLDSLTVNAVKALEAAVSTYKSVCESLQAMLETYQHHHLETLASVRAHYLAKTEAEAEVMDLQRQQTEGGDPATSMMLGVLMKHLGIEAPSAETMAAASRVAAAGKKPPGKKE